MSSAARKLSDMHFSNYISMAQAKACVARGIKRVTLTPTALRQTPERTISFLKGNGVKVEVVASRGRPRRLREADVKRLLAMRRAGVSFYKIARVLGIPKSTVFDYFKRYSHVRISDVEVEKLQVNEARRVLRRIASTCSDPEVRQMAERALSAANLEELEYYLQEILLCLTGE